MQFDVQNTYRGSTLLMSYLEFVALSPIVAFIDLRVLGNFYNEQFIPITPTNFHFDGSQ